MSKTLMDKKVNSNIKRLNRQLRQDVFGTRFEARQVKKIKGEDGVQYYLYELRDNEQPERNCIYSGWLSGFSIIEMNKVWWEMNNFIIKSDFWEKYKANN